MMNNVSRNVATFRVLGLFPFSVIKIAKTCPKEPVNLEQILKS